MLQPNQTAMGRRLRAAGLLVVAVASLAGCALEARTGQTAEEVRVCARGTVTEGIDVSVYQGTINWPAVRAGGKSYAIIRVGDGLSLDRNFATNWAGARSAGVIRGVYQFFRPARDPIAQADLMLQNMGPLSPDDLPPSLDVEAADGQTQAVITSKIHLWIDYVRAATGREPIIYSGLYFWPASVGSNDFVNSPLWIPQYGPTCPSLPVPWTDWLIFQYSSTGVVSGITGNVDLDRFNGSQTELLDYIRLSMVDGGVRSDAAVDSAADATRTDAAPSDVMLRDVGGSDVTADIGARDAGGQNDSGGLGDSGSPGDSSGPSDSGPLVYDGVGCGCRVPVGQRRSDSGWGLALVGVMLGLWNLRARGRTGTAVIVQSSSSVRRGS